MKNVYALDNSEFLKYHSLTQRLMRSWKDKLKNDNALFITPEKELINQLNEAKSSNNFLYNTQLNNIKSSLVIKPHTKWEQEVNNVEWKTVHKIRGSSKKF